MTPEPSGKHHCWLSFARQRILQWRGLVTKNMSVAVRQIREERFESCLTSRSRSSPNLQLKVDKNGTCMVCKMFSAGRLIGIRAHAGATVNVGVDPSKVVIIKLKLDKDRNSILNRKKGAADKGKGKFTEQEVQAMQDVD